MKLKIRTITWGQLRQSAKFENNRLELTAELGKGEDAEECLAELKRAVTRMMMTDEEREEVRAHLRRHNLLEEAGILDDFDHIDCQD